MATRLILNVVIPSGVRSGQAYNLESSVDRLELAVVIPSGVRSGQAIIMRGGGLQEEAS